MLTGILNLSHNTASTYHVVNYNRTTGAVVWQRTAQGYADNRCAPFGLAEYFYANQTSS